MSTHLTQVVSISLILKPEFCIGLIFIFLSSRNCKLVISVSCIFRISLAIITPFYSASLVETAQSEVASETAGFFDVFREGLWRLLSWPSTGRLVPLHVLVIPTVAHGILSYLIYTGIRSVSLATIKRVRESKERKLVCSKIQRIH